MPAAESKPAAANPEPAPRKKRRLVALLGGLALACAAAGGAWMWMQQDAQAAHAPRRKALFTAMEPFTVNLREPRGDRFAQIGVTLEYEDPELEARIRDSLPALRNNILLLLSSKQVDDLLAPEGKQLLAREIRDSAAVALGAGPAAGASAARAAANPVRAVLFSQFIVQ